MNTLNERSNNLEIYELGEKPPMETIPEKMHAFCVRQDRFGQPKDAWQREIIPVPDWCQRCAYLHHGHRN